jgi:hypothetical protein
MSCITISVRSLSVRAAAAPPTHTPRASARQVAVASKAAPARAVRLQRNASELGARGLSSARRSSGVCHAAGDDGSATPDGNVTMINSADEWREALSGAGDKLVGIPMRTSPGGVGTRPCSPAPPRQLPLAGDKARADGHAVASARGSGIACGSLGRGRYHCGPIRSSLARWNTVVSVRRRCRQLPRASRTEAAGRYTGCTPIHNRDDAPRSRHHSQQMSAHVALRRASSDPCDVDMCIVLLQN